MSLRTYVVDNHDGIWLSGKSIVFAPDPEAARTLLDKALTEDGLQPYAKHDYTLREVDTSAPRAIIIDNGDY